MDPTETQARAQVFHMDSRYFADEGIAIQPEMMWSTIYPPLPCADNSMILAWTNESDGTLSAQKVDIEGNLLWGDEGLDIYQYNDPNYCGQTEIFTDGAGGLLAVTSLDHIATTDLDYVVYQHVTSEGDLDWGEGFDSPVQLDSPENFDVFHSAVDSAGGLFVTWLYVDPMNSTSSLSVQHINSQGATEVLDDATTLTSWSNDEYSMLDFIPVVSTPGSMVLVTNYWDLDEHYHIGTQRISTEDGALVTNWIDRDLEGLGLRVVRRAYEIHFASIQKAVSDDEGGVFLFFSVDSINPGVGDIVSVIGQHISVDPEYCWGGVTGSPLPFTLTNTEPGIQVQPNSMTNINIFREVHSPDLQASCISYCVDKELGPSEIQPDPCVLYSYLDGSCSEPVLAEDPVNSAVWIGWIDGRYSQNTMIPYIQRLDLETGDSQFAFDSLSILEATLPEDTLAQGPVCTGLTMLSDDDGNCYICWNQYHQDEGVRIQKIDPQGNLLLGEEPIRVDAYLEPYYLSSPHMILSPDQGVYIAYTKLQPPNRNTNHHFLQRLTPEGDPYWSDDIWRGSISVRITWIT